MSCKYLWPCQDFLISTSNNKKDEHSPGNTVLLTFSWTEQKVLAWVPRILIFNKTSMIDLDILESALPCLSREQFQEQAAHPPFYQAHFCHSNITEAAVPQVRHYLELAPPASVPRSGDALGDFLHLIQEVCIYIFPTGNCGCYHLSSIENYMDKFTKACKSQVQCAWYKYNAIKRAFPFSQKANYKIRIVIRCKTLQLNNEMVRKQKVLL